MKTASTRQKLLLGIGLTVLVVATVLTIWVTVKWNRVARFQACFDRAWEISYNVNHDVDRLPAFLDEMVMNFISSRYSAAGYPHAYDSLVRARYESLFVGPIHSIDVYYPEQWQSEGIAEAIRGFPKLRKLTISEGPEDADAYISLCRQLAETPLVALRLEIAQEFDQQALKELRDSETLRELVIIYAPIDPEMTEILIGWSELERLVLVNEEGEISEADLDRIHQARPGFLSTEDPGRGAYCPNSPAP